MLGWPVLLRAVVVGSFLGFGHRRAWGQDWQVEPAPYVFVRPEGVGLCWT